MYQGDGVCIGDGVGIDYSNQAILIQGPSRIFWMNHQGYHRKKVCASTEKAHLATINAIKADVSCQFSYWLLIFPEGVVLDNVIFSHDPEHMSASSIGLMEPVGGVDFRTLMVNWVVAEKYGGRRVGGKKKTTINDESTMNSLFAD